ncbi:restriction endonuclease subunit S [Serratia sp. IR-2025]
MAKYKAYPEYKDSGVEWLGDIPRGWTISRVKYLAPFQVGWTPSTKNDANFIGDNLWVNISDLKEKFISSTAKCISDKAAKEASMDITPRGSLLYSFKLSVGAVSFAGCDLYTNEAIASFLNHAHLPLSYLYYALPIFIIENASTNIYGAKILNQELIKNAFLLAPSHSEAEKVANFLDHETAKIDNLIEKQQQLIELLKEKRQAVISHAVTKGLNPDVPMKDSGVEWLGEVPVHWTVMQMRHAILRIEQGKSPECEARNAEDYEWGVLKSGCVNGGIFNEKEHKALPISIKPNVENEVHPGELIMSRASGSADLIGSMAFIYSCRGKLLLSDKTFRVIPTKKVLPEFLSFLMGSLPMRNQIKSSINGAEGLANNITKESIKSFYSVVPCLNEQVEIVSLINEKNKIFKQLEVKLGNSLRLLQERRTALISAAVTGKIDVRDWVAPDMQDAEEPQETTA